MRHLLLLVAFVGLAAPAGAQRLPGTVVPDHYELWFGPDLQRDTFAGRETIHVRLTRSSRTITLHAAEIAFTEVSVTAAGTSQPAQVSLDARAETATFTVARAIPAGAATIQISYTGILNDKLRGFYRSQANGRKYAVTQLEPTDGRRAFPSFDEPTYKATFEISATIDAGDSAISNGAQIADTPGPGEGKHTVRFATTPKMSPYLVAMLVGDFVCRSGQADGTAIRVCSTPDKLALTGFALEAAEQQLAFFNRYLGIPYPFGKLDLIGVPDFSAGAMENAGAITFREQALLVDPARASFDARKNVAGIVSHEIAHQWLGNLVTMRWWNDIWLNEGFATWLANKPLAAWRPDWNVELDDAGDTQTAIGLDSLASTRPIRIEVETPAQISEVFDGLAYQKTAAVLRMIEGYVGAEAFRQALQSYLKKHAFGNATGEDLWAEVSRVTGRPVDRIMRSYMLQPGAPVLSVQTSCSGGTNRVTLTQRRFSSGTAPAESQTWSTPVCFSTGTGQPQCEVLDRQTQTFTLPTCGPVFANAGSRGYYLSEYPPDSAALSKMAASLTPVERLGLLGDEWWMVRSGRHDVGVYLDLAASLATDATPAVIDDLANRLSFVGTYLVAEPQRDMFQAWIRRRFGPSLSALGNAIPPDPDDPSHRKRATLLGLVGGAGQDPAVQRRTRNLALRYLADRASLPGTLVPTVLRVGASTGNTELYEQYISMIETLSAEPEEYYRFLYALPSFNTPEHVERTLEFALSPAVRSQDAGGLISVLTASPASQDAAWGFIKAEWKALTAKLDVFQGLPNVVAGLGTFCSREKAADVRKFFATNSLPEVERTLERALERIDACVALAARQQAPFARWLETAQ